MIDDEMFSKRWNYLASTGQLQLINLMEDLKVALYPNKATNIKQELQYLKLTILIVV